MQLPYLLLEDKKHKEIVYLLLFFKYNSNGKFLWLKEYIFYLFYISCSFPVVTVVCGEKYILTNLTNSKEQEPHILAPWSRSRLKKKNMSWSYWEKIRSWSPKQIMRLPTPQPCFKILIYIT